MLPKKFPPQATIGIFNPSGLVSDPDKIGSAARYFERLGHSVFLDERVANQWKYFAGTDDERLAAINAMLRNPEIDVVMAARGGYGLSRILQRIDFSEVAASRKIFIGHSDFDIFHLAHLRQGGVGFAGPMPAVDFFKEENSAFTEKHFWGLLSATEYSIDSIASDHDYAPQTIEGVIWGGNLSVLVHLVGTKYFPQIDGGILFVEEINEEPYHIERMLLQLKHAGVLDKQKAVLFGQFNRCLPTQFSSQPYNLDDVMQTMREIIACPMLTNLPFGHVENKITIPVGAMAKLSIKSNSYNISFRGYCA
ncbi:MAG: LD-carboxypeptidase [Burkholderiales bacterium]